MLSKNQWKEDRLNMNMIYATYNILHNSIDVYTYAGYFLRIDCNKAEEGLKTTPCSECALNALAIDEPLEYARTVSWREYANVDGCGGFIGIMVMSIIIVLICSIFV